MVGQILIGCIICSCITATLTAWVVGTLAARRYSRIEELVLKDMAERYEKISIELLGEKINQIYQVHKPL